MLAIAEPRAGSCSGRAGNWLARCPPRKAAARFTLRPACGRQSGSPFGCWSCRSGLLPGVSKDRLRRQRDSQPAASATTLSPGYAGKSNFASRLPLPTTIRCPPRSSRRCLVPRPLPPDANSALDASQYLKTTADGHVIAEVTDLLFAAEDESMRPAFREAHGRDDRPVSSRSRMPPTAGFRSCGCSWSAARRTPGPSRWPSCRPADDRPPSSPARWRGRRWSGTVEFPLENGRRVPIIHAQTATPCDPPSEAMLYATWRLALWLLPTCRRGPPRRFAMTSVRARSASNAARPICVAAVLGPAHPNRTASRVIC